jgi:hypothetical protein
MRLDLNFDVGNITLDSMTGVWLEDTHAGCALSFLQQELPAMLEYLGVSKRICLYLARKNAQQTIDHLVYEVSLQLLEEEGPAASSSSGGTASGGYQHQRPGPPLEFAAVLQQVAGEAKAAHPRHYRESLMLRGCSVFNDMLTGAVPATKLTVSACTALLRRLEQHAAPSTSTGIRLWRRSRRQLCSSPACTALLFRLLVDAKRGQ